MKILDEIEKVKTRFIERFQERERHLMEQAIVGADHTPYDIAMRIFELDQLIQQDMDELDRLEAIAKQL